MTAFRRRFGPFIAGLALTALALPAFATDACKNRGELDTMYCDDNNDMVADAPADPKKWKNPSTIVFTYTPVEDPAVYENVFKPFTTHLAACLNRKVVFYQVQSNASEVEAMRSAIAYERRMTAPAASAWRSTPHSTSSSGIASR